VRLDFSYAVNSDTTGLGFHESTALITGMANIVYHFQGSRPHLYALLGVGYFGRRFSTDDPDDEAINDSRFAFQVGEGLTFRVGSATLFIEGRFVSGTGEDPLRFFPVVIGVRFGGPKQ
jgi:opacity protein-like surface antigen